MPRIPYGWLPRHWGAKGKQREIEKANYELEGEELERRLAEINSENSTELAKAYTELDFKYGHLGKEEYETKMAEFNLDGKELQKELLKIKRKYNKLSKREFDEAYAELEYDEDEMSLSLARLEIQKKYGDITETEYEKGVASLHGEPWVGVIGSEYNPGDGADGFSFELDWNEAFVEMLINNGYEGNTAEQVVEQWFEDTSTSEYMRMINEMAANEEFDDSVPVTNTRHERLDGGKTRHS